MPKTAYLAQPIDQVNIHVDSLVWNLNRQEVCDVLVRGGHHVYLPASSWAPCRAAGPDPRIEQVNDTALASSDILVAVLPARTPTVGVPMEIERARQLGIPVVVLTDITTSMALCKPGVWLIEKPHELTELLPNLPPRPQEHPALWVVVQGGFDPPRRAYPDDAGLDLTTSRQCSIAPGQFLDIHTQVDAVQLPPGYWGLITGRSSTLRKHGLHVPVAVIDPGWRGPLFIGVWNLGRDEVIINPGDRLGQIILMPNTTMPAVVVDAVGDAPRGTLGFGSSGR